MKIVKCKIHNFTSDGFIYLMDYYNYSYLVEIIIDAIIEECLCENGVQYIVDYMDIESVFYVPTLDALWELKQNIGSIIIEVFEEVMKDIIMHSPGLPYTIRSTWKQTSIYDYYGTYNGDLIVDFKIK